MSVVGFSRLCRDKGLLSANSWPKLAFGAAPHPVDRKIAPKAIVMSYPPLSVDSQVSSWETFLEELTAFDGEDFTRGFIQYLVGLSPNSPVNPFQARLEYMHFSQQPNDDALQAFMLARCTSRFEYAELPASQVD